MLCLPETAGLPQGRGAIPAPWTQPSMNDRGSRWISLPTPLPVAQDSILCWLLRVPQWGRTAILFNESFACLPFLSPVPSPLCVSWAHLQINHRSSSLHITVCKQRHPHDAKQTPPWPRGAFTPRGEVWPWGLTIGHPVCLLGGLWRPNSPAASWADWPLCSLGSSRKLSLLNP